MALGLALGPGIDQLPERPLKPRMKIPYPSAVEDAASLLTY